MQPTDVNPYRAPNPEDQLTQDNGGRFWWRILPALFTLVIGICAFAMGVFAVCVMSYIVVVDGDLDYLPGMLAGCSAYLGLGIAWIVAARYYWIGSFRAALIATVAGVSFPITGIAIFGV